MFKRIMRASSLPSFNDCALNASCHIKVIDGDKQVGLPEFMGFTLNRSDKSGRKSVVGTALHKAGETYLQAKIDKKPISLLAAREAMMQNLDENFVEDEETNAAEKKESRPIATKDSAAEYLDAMWRTLGPVVEKFDPIAVEIETTRVLDENTVITGHPDWVLRVPGGIKVDDLKTTGAPVPMTFPAQVGEYINQIEDMGLYEEEIVEGGTTAVRRLKQKPPTVHKTSYDVGAIKEFANNTAHRFSANIDRFLATGDPNSFNANPKSNICNPKYCPAYGTDYCKVGR